MKIYVFSLAFFLSSFLYMGCSSRDKSQTEVLTDTLIVRDTVTLEPEPMVIAFPMATQVLYHGVENPIELITSGISAEDLQVEITNGELLESNGQYRIVPGRGPVVTLRISSVGEDTALIDLQEFRVKHIPDPKPFFGGKTGSDNIPIRDLLAAQGVIAKMENFELDTRFEIVSYSVSATVRGHVVDAPCRGARLTGDARTIIRELKSGQKLYIEKIKAKGPDGTIRDLGTITLRVI